MGAGAVAEAVIEVVWVGTTKMGGVTTIGTSMEVVDRLASERVALPSRRASTKYSSGTDPVLAIRTLAVVARPAGSFVAAESGSVLVAVTGVRLSVTVNGWLMAVPDT